MKFVSILAILLLSQCLYSQGRYEKKWEKVEELELENKIEDAQKIVQRIDRKAKRRGDDDQLIKAFIYDSKFELIKSKGAFERVQKELQNKIENSQASARNIYQMIYAKFLVNFKDREYRNIQQRNKFEVEIDPTNAMTWTSNYLDNLIDHLFTKSIEFENLQAKTSIKEYATIIQDTTYTSKWRPTILDLTTREALGYYKSKLDYYAYDGVDAKIIKESIKTNPDFSLLASDVDSDKKLIHIINIYQTLEKQHLKNDNQAAYIKTVVERVDYVKEFARSLELNEEAAITLKELSNNYENLPEHTVALYQMALYSHNEARIYSSIDPSNKEETNYRIKKRARAIELAQRAIERFPKSYGAKQSKALLKLINQSEASLGFSGNLYPDQYYLTSVKFKNIDSLKIRWNKLSFVDYINSYDSLVDVIYQRNK